MEKEKQSMETAYLYDFNKERYQRLFDRTLVCREALHLVTVEQGYLLPNRYAQNRLFGHGGVLNARLEYEKASEMNAYSKYAITPKETDEREIYLGEGYAIEEEKAAYFDEEIVYLGYINNHWGHFLLDSTTRLYPFLTDTKKQYKYAFLVNEGQDYTPIPSIRRFFELLGISGQLLFINQVTKCRKILIPEQGYMVNGYYSKEFLKIFQKVADGVDCTKYPSYQKVYYSRAHLKKAKDSELGEEVLLHFFQKNGFTMIAPESCTLDEQIAIIRNTELLAAITGTIPHNLLFAKPGQKMLILNKTHNLNVAQMDINAMMHAEVTYIDTYLAKFPVLIGMGPFLLDYSSELAAYGEAEGWKNPDQEVLSGQQRKMDYQKYEQLFRMKNLKNLALHYQKNEERFDYFHPQHLIVYEEKTYAEKNPPSVREQLRWFWMRVKNKWQSGKKK